MPKTKTPTIDLTSDEIVLAYVDERGRAPVGVPARDLTHNDIARIEFRARLAEVANDVGRPIDSAKPDGPKFERPDHKSVDQARAAKVYAGLLASGLYSDDADLLKAARDRAAPPAPEPEAVAAAPAESEG